MDAFTEEVGRVYITFTIVVGVPLVESQLPLLISSYPQRQECGRGNVEGGEIYIPINL